MHGIFYDDVHDEIVVPVALGGAVLTLPGDAAGDAPPKRVLQGPKTGIVQPDTIFVDLEHDELIVESGDDAVLVFPRTAVGDVAPKRRIGGPNSGVNNIYGLAAASKLDCIVVANRVEGGGRQSDDAILVFNRLDNGDPKPRTKISGPHTGIIKIRQVFVDEERGLIFETIKINFEAYKYADHRPSTWDVYRYGL